MNTYSDAFKKEAVRLLSVSGTPAAHIDGAVNTWIEVRPR